MNFKQDRNDLKLEDIIYNDYEYIANYGRYELTYKQNTNCLCRFPELLKLFDEGYYIEHANSWKSFRVMRKHPQVYDKKFVAEILFNAFSGNKNLAICYDYFSEVTVYSTNLYVYEDFEHFRNRTLFELRDFLGKGHFGHGEDSKRLSIQDGKDWWIEFNKRGRI